jgi:hypothetical protein
MNHGLLARAGVDCWHDAWSCLCNWLCEMYVLCIVCVAIAIFAMCLSHAIVPAVLCPPCLHAACASACLCVAACVLCTLCVLYITHLPRASAALLSPACNMQHAVPTQRTYSHLH